jgi:8-oxo-dGTP pyrophosphatase MutT (NUDIX family)
MSAIECCGGILVHEHEHKNEYYYALVYGHRHGKWSFPKGHINPDETFDECMFREIYEETGLALAKLQTYLVSSPVILMNQYYRIFLMPNMPQLDTHDVKEVAKAKWIAESDIDKEFLRQCNVAVRCFFRKRGICF